MKALQLTNLTNLNENLTPLKEVDLPVPQPGPGEVLVKVSACGVCHTELDEIEGRTPPSRLPVVLGHQVVGRVVEVGNDAHRYSPGERVGIGWIYSACGHCTPACREMKTSARISRLPGGMWMVVTPNIW